jgi:hypothetical protein
MDVKRSRSPRAPPDDDRKRAGGGGGWRGSGGVRPEMVLVGFLLTLPLLFLVFGGRWGSSSFPSSSSSSSSATSSPPVVPKPTARRVDGGGGDRGATPRQGQSKPPCPALRAPFWACGFRGSRTHVVARSSLTGGHSTRGKEGTGGILRRGLGRWAYEPKGETLSYRMQFPCAFFCSSWRKASWRFVGRQLAAH